VKALIVFLHITTGTLKKWYFLPHRALLFLLKAKGKASETGESISQLRPVVDGEGQQYFVAPRAANNNRATLCSLHDTERIVRRRRESREATYPLAKQQLP
jgi:hypothetical protein